MSELSHPSTVGRCHLKVEHKDEKEKPCEASHWPQLIYEQSAGEQTVEGVMTEFIPRV